MAGSRSIVMDGVFRFPLDTGDDPADRHREVLNQGTMDCNECLLARHAPLADIFEDWNLRQRPVTGNIIDEIPWWEKYKLPMLPSGDAPRGGAARLLYPCRISQIMKARVSGESSEVPTVSDVNIHCSICRTLQVKKSEGFSIRMHQQQNKGTFLCR